MKALVPLLILALAACATQPVPDFETMPVPVKRILNQVYLNPGPRSGQVSVKRDSGLRGAACSIRVLIDAQPVVDLRRAEKIILHLPAGDHVLSATGTTGLCSGAGVPEVRATVREGDEITFRVGHGMNGDLTISQTAF
jgi:hypothetical protein